MPDVNKLLGSGVVSGTMPSPQTAYTPLSGARATVIKSMILTNTSSSTVTVSVLINGYYILSVYSIKPFDTIVVPVVDQVLSGTGDAIKIGASASGVVFYYISGVEYDTSDVNSDYYYVRPFARTGVAAADGNKVIGATSTAKRIIKSMIVCNVSNSEATLGIVFAGVQIVSGFKIKANDTIIVPTFDAMLENGSQIICSASNLVNMHISAKEVT